MRQRATTIAIGLLAGIAGAVVVRQFPATASAPTAVASPTRELPTALIVPPGWDRRYVERLAALEGRVHDLGTEPPRAEPTTSGLTARAQAKAQHYEQELEHQRGRVERHALEPVDSTWSHSQTEQLRTTFASMTARREILADSVDCRSATCVATLTFPSPSDALAFLASPSLRTLGRDLHGLTSTPTPPTSAGAYDLTIVLDR